MALDTSIFAADLAAMVADLPVTVTFGGTGYSGTMGEISREKQMDDAGFLPQADAELHTTQAAFSDVTAPTVNDQFTIAGTVYRIVRRDDDQTSAGFRFMLKRLN